MSHLMTKPTKWPSKNSDQPGHPPSLIRVFAVPLKKARIPSYPLIAERRLIRLGGCPGWAESSLGAHAILLVLSWGGSNHEIENVIVFFFSDNIGESIIYLWVEKIREFLQEKTSGAPSGKCTVKILSFGADGPGHAKTFLMPYANNKGADHPAQSDQHLAA